jgi:hypothetical protein
MDGFKNSSYKFARKQDFFPLFQNLAYFDVALVRIQKVEFSDFIHSVCIPQTAGENEDIFSEQFGPSITIPGWNNLLNQFRPSDTYLNVYSYR